jgi:hypothetical protein
MSLTTTIKKENIPSHRRCRQTQNEEEKLREEYITEN